MDFWSYLLIFGSSALVVLVISRLAPGLFSAVINILRSILEFVLHHLPAPVKYGLVIALVVAVGSLITTYTIGLSYVCLNDGEGDAVYKVPMYVGLSMQSWVDLEGTLAKVTVKNRNIIETNLWGFSGSCDNMNYTESSGGTLALCAAVSHAGLSEEWIGQDVSRVPPVEQFSNLFGADLAIFDICLNNEDESCIYVRRWPVLLGPCSASGDWDTYIGIVRYRMKNATSLGSEAQSAYDGRLEVSYEDQIGVSDSRCTVGEGDPFLDELQPQSIFVKTDGFWPFPDREHDILVYNVDYFELMRTYEDQADVEAGEFFWEVPDDVLNEIVQDVIASGERVGSQRGDVLKYSCNKDTRDEPFDVNMTMFGINPFDPTVIIFFFLFAGILAIYKYFDK